jgi:AraC-like DNA-binding protein
MRDALTLRQYGASPGSHAHDHFQILLGVDGALELEVQGQGRRIAAGDGCVIGPGDRHDFESRSGAQCWVLDTSQSDWGQCPQQPAQSTVAKALAVYLQAALRQGHPLALHYAPALLLDCWRLPEEAPGRAQRPIDWRALQSWARLHWHTPLTVADLAEQVFLSPTQFATRCRAANGTSPMQWLRQLRLAHAKALRGDGLSVAQTALRCGYQSASALTAALRVNGH